MKYLVSFLCICLVVVGFSQEAEEPVGGARISFEDSSFDFGDITQGEKVEHYFFFENVGNEP